jgi:plasmid stabilization system protein ParE
MKFNVVWTQAAEDDLATLWTQADDRSAVTSAAHMVDGILSRKPDLVGEPFFDTVRTFAADPLGVDYEVIEADRIVYVLAAWDTRRPERG